MANTVGTAYVQILPSAKGIGSKIGAELNGAAGSAGTQAGTTIGSKIKGAITVAGIGKVVGASIMEGSKLEQSLGGVETLFKESAGKVKNYAKQSFETTGLSANEYMENVTSFSASLISSLGGNTKKAAELSNTAMVDMSDNANKMGTDMEMITGTYQSLARGNYQMLDNLKLGYGGTKGEMQRLMKDAEKLTGEHYTVGDFADTIKAIHAIQDNLGITGTTAKEASTTMEGSWKQLKSSWQDLLGNLALGKDIEPQIKNVMESVKTVIKNYAPAIKNVFEGIWDQIPMPGKILVGLVGVKKGIQGIGAGVGAAKGSISALAGNIRSAGANIKAFNFAAKGMQGPVMAGTSTASKLGGAMFKLKSGFATAGSAIGKAMAGMGKAVGSAFASIGRVLMANPWMIAIAAAIAATILIIKNWDKVKKFLTKLWNGIKKTASKTWTAIKNAIMKPVNGVKKALSAAWNAIKKTAFKVWSAIKGKAQTAWKGIKNAILTPVRAAKAGLKTIWSGMKNTATAAWRGTKKAASTIWGGIKTAILTPVRAAKRGVSVAVTGIKKAFNGMKSLKSSVGKTFSAIRSKISISGVAKGLKKGVGKIKDVFKSISKIHIKTPHISISSATTKKKFLGRKWKYPTFHISWHKEGGIFTKPTLLGDGTHGVGEAGAEAVLPLNTLWSKLDTMAGRIVEGTQSAAAPSGGTLNLIITLDGKTIGKSATDYINGQTITFGTSPIMT